ncbi:MAG: DNRLRE domain-containing protein [Actinomycetia bacterium]|nr:DNRLRE domain-containing protein [Actinomycetes bacterium]
MAYRGGRWQRIVATTLSVVLLSSVVQIAPAAAAAPEPAPVRREVLEKRTERSKIYDNGDGTFSYEEYPEPIHYRPTPSSPWAEIDSSLVDTVTPDGPGVTNRANDFKVFLPADSAHAPVVVSTSDGTIRMTPRGRPLELPVAAVDEATASPVAMDASGRRFDGAIDGGDLLYESFAAGLKETIVLERRTGKSTFSFDLECPGLSPRIEEDGRISFVSESTGQSVFTMPRPFMEDSSAEASGAAVSEDVHYELKAQNLDWRLDVVADRDWLMDPARIYPVKIDPTTYVDQKFLSYLGDTYVSDAYPTTNYGYSTRLRVGRLDATTGNCYTYVKPDLQSFVADAREYGWVVSDADLKIYCYDRYSSSGSVYIDEVDSAWSETTMTWNNKPAATYMAGYDKSVPEATWADFQVQSQIQKIIDGTHGNHGFRLRAYAGSSGYAQFYSFDALNSSYPYFVIRFTTRPKITVTSPKSGIDVAGGFKATWAYADEDGLGGKAQAGAACEIWDRPAGETEVATPVRLWNGSIETSATWMNVGAPTGGWQAGKRYFFRARVKAATDNSSHIAWSEWSEWEAFTYRPSLDTSDGKGIEGYRAAESIGGGASVDLATGRLNISRTDFSGPGLAGPLGVSATYDSSVTTPNAEGLGTGWHLNVPKLAFDDQRAPNPGFESYVAGTYDPTGWYMSDSGHITTTSSYHHTGSRSAVLTWTDTTTWGNVYLASTSYIPNALAVHPGQRIKASGWVRTSGLAVDSTQAERGAILKLKFFDESGTAKSWVTSSPYTTGTQTTWTPISVETVVPDGCYRARVTAELRNARGTIYFDDITFADETLRFTDADGTTRAYTPAGDGAYGRDPLAGGVAFERANIARGMDVAHTPGAPGLDTNASTDGDTTDSSYDSVDWKADGTYWLKYDLKRPRLISEVGMRLLDTMSPDRSYTYRIEASADGVSWATVVAQTTGRSWVHHSFSPVRARYLRVVALGNTYTGDVGFRIAELEVLETSIGKVPVAFDQLTGKVTGFGDTDGNVLAYRYDASNRLLSVQENVSVASAETTRGVSLVWNGSSLASLSWRGVSSTGTVATETGVVVYGSSGSTVTVSAPDGEGSSVGVAYHYNGSGRIDGVADADGVASAIAYDALGRVWKVTAASGATTTFTYARGSATIVTSGGSADLTKVVAFDTSRGCGATSITSEGDQGDLTTTYGVDGLGHVVSVTDAAGGVDTFACDAHGNVVYTSEKGSLETSATYTADRQTSSTDAKGNLSTTVYDDRWRPLVSTVAAANDVENGAIGSRTVYDEWGNRVLGDLPSSTAHNLVLNGTFETDPNTSGSGWSAKSDTGSISWPTATQPYLGRRTVRIGGPTMNWIASDLVDVDASATYMLSAWAAGSGDLRVREFASDGTTYLRTIHRVAPIAADISLPLARVSGVYTPSSDAKKVRIELNADTGDCLLDNVRFERANVLGPDVLVENESFERYSGTLPVFWTNRTVGTATEEVVVTDREEGLRAAHIKGTETTDGTGSGYMTSGYIPVKTGEKYMASAWLRTYKVTSTVGLGASASVLYYDSAKTYLGVSRETSITPAHISGTTPWTRYIAPVDIAQSDVAFVTIRVRASRCAGDSYFDAVSFQPAAEAEITTYDSTHTFAVSATTSTGHEASAESDLRGRTTESRYSITPGEDGQILAQNTYDKLGRLTNVSQVPTSGAGIEASFGYTAAGCLTTLIAPGGGLTTLDYDSAGRVQSVTSPLGYLTAMRYDALGRLSAVMRPRLAGQAETTLTTSAYDSYGRVSGTTTFDASGTPVLSSTSTYDRLSRVTASTVSGETTVSASVHYDALGRVDSSAATDVAGSSRTTTAYDKSSLPVTVTWSALDTSATVTNAYAKTDQWRSTTGFGDTWKYSWTDGGGLASVFSDFASRYYAFDPAGRLSSVRLGCPDDGAVGEDVGRIDVAYDDFDRIKTLTGHGLGTLAATDEFSYDPAGRLTGWTRDGVAASTGAWAYDADGNITTATRGGVTSSYEYDGGERLTTATVGAVTSVYTHDEFGRRTSVAASGETTTFAWNASGQLSRVASSDATATYEYGAGGMRARKTVESGSVSRTTEYFYAGSQLTAERDSDGTLYRYLYGPGGAPLEVVVTTGTVTARYALQTDALGSVVAISSEGGAPVATYAYDPWGAPLETRMLAGSTLDRAVAARQPFRYRGYTLDAETGLYYLPARYYDPATALFLSPDPAAPSAGDPASLNPYMYCQDDPIGASDPTGAIMDADGDGKVNAVDCAEQMARLSSGTKMANHWRQRANAEWRALKARQAALAAARAAALAAAKAAALDRAARMQMAHARVAASLAMKPTVVGIAVGVATDCDAGQNPVFGPVSDRDIGYDGVAAALDVVSICFLAVGIIGSTSVVGAPVGGAAILVGIGLKSLAITLNTVSTYDEMMATQRGHGHVGDAVLTAGSWVPGGSCVKLGVDMSNYWGELMVIFMFGAVVMIANAVRLAVLAIRTGDSAQVRRKWRLALPGWVDLVGGALLVAGALISFGQAPTFRDVAIALGAALSIVVGVSIAKAQFLSWVFMYLSGREKRAALRLNSEPKENLEAPR